MGILLGLFSLIYLLVLAWHLGQIALGVEPTGSLGLLRELTLYFFLPAPILLLLALVFRARAAIALSLLPLALFVLLYAPRFAPTGQVAAATPTLRVLTFNAGAGPEGGDPRSVLSAVQTADADIVALQEVPGPALQLLGSTLGGRYPYRARTPDVATFSAHPLVDPTEVRLRGSGYSSQAVDILVADRVVRLTNVHLQRSGPRLAGGRSIVRFARAFESELLDSQVRELLERYVRPVNGTQLVAGDFNQTEWSRPYEMLADVLQDSFREVGRGFGHTFPSAIDIGTQELPLPLVRIDYIFHSADLVALSSQVGPDGRSDHLPVIAELGFR